MNQRKLWPSSIAFMVLVLCTLVSTGVVAQVEPQKRQQAKEHYERATRLFDVGKYSDAISEYEAAYLLIEDAALLYNIGQAYRLWDHPDDAIRAYKNYLRRRPEASNRAEVERKIAELERVTDERRRGVAAPLPVPQAAVTPTSNVNQALPSPAAQVAASPPPSSLPTASPSDAVTPSALPSVASAVAEVGTSPPSESAAAKSNWLSYSLIGVGGACLVASVIAAGVGASKASKLRDASQKGQPFDPAVEANGKTANRVAVVTLLAGLATGAAGGYMLWRSVGAAPATVSFLPVLVPSFAGGTAQVVF